MKDEHLVPRRRRRQETWNGKPVAEAAALQWLRDNRHGSIPEIAAAIERPYMTVYWAVMRMERDGLAKQIRAAEHKKPALWAPTTRKLPLKAISVTGLVRDAIQNQHPLAKAWAQPMREAA